MSLHEIAPRLAVARDERLIEITTGYKFLHVGHVTRTCRRCGGVIDTYRLAMDRGDGNWDTLTGSLERCRSCDHTMPMLRRSSGIPPALVAWGRRADSGLMAGLRARRWG